MKRVIIFAVVVLGILSPLAPTLSFAQTEESASAKSDPSVLQQYQTLKGQQKEHRDASPKLAAEMFSDEVLTYGGTPEEMTFLSEQIDYANRLLSILEPFKKNRREEFYKEKLEIILLYNRIDNQQAALTHLESIIGDLTEALAGQPENLLPLQLMHASLLSGVGLGQVAINTAVPAFGAEQSRIMSLDYSSDNFVSLITLSEKFEIVANVLRGAGEADDVVRFLDDIVDKASEYFAQCASSNDAKTCKYAKSHIDRLRVQIADYYKTHMYYNGASIDEHHVKLWAQKEIDLRLIIFEGAIERCEKRLEEDRECRSYFLRTQAGDMITAYGHLGEDEPILSIFEKAYTLATDWSESISFKDAMESYTSAAINSNQPQRAIDFLKSYGLSGNVQQTENAEIWKARYAELEPDFESGTNLEEPQLRERTEAALNAFGDNSSQYRFALGSLGLYLHNKGDREAIALSRKLYDMSYEPDFLGKTDYQRVYHAADNLLTTYRHFDGDKKAIEELDALLKLPDEEIWIQYWQDRLQDGRIRLDAELDFWYRLAQLKGDIGIVSQAQHISVFVALGLMARNYSINSDPHSEEEFRKQVSGDVGLFQQNPRQPFEFSGNLSWDEIEAGNLSMEEKNEYRRYAFVVMQLASIDSASLAVSRSAAEKLAVASGAADLLTARKAIMARFKSKMKGDNPYNDLASNTRAIVALAPDYLKISRPSALDDEAAMDMLASDEATVLIVPTDEGTHIFAVTDKGLTWKRSELTHSDITTAVKKLRATLDQSLSNDGSGYFKAFDFKTSSQLYNALFRPILPALEGRDQLFISAGGALSSLPFGVLVSSDVSDDPAQAETLRNAPWLDNQFALTQIPSLQSLQRLRSQSATLSAPTRTLDGFGAPALDGNFQSSDMRPEDIEASERSAGYVMANVTELKKLSPLSGARRELNALRRVLGVRAADKALRLQDAATETAVKIADLSDTKVLAFATHGLMSGEIDSIAEPGLVFTPPDVPTNKDDGYLTASETAQLTLNAEWVILSACNTASGGEPGGAGLSGLAQAFFFAGADRLLATHWPVRDDVAVQLVPEIFNQLNANTNLSRSEALRKSVEVLRNDMSDPSKAHPAAWAPFVLVGDR